MPVRRRKDNGKWIYRTLVKLPDDTKVRIFGMPQINTKEAAEKAERAHIEKVLAGKTKKEVPTFAEWFWGSDAEAIEPSGRFWKEWVIARKNKPSETESKKSIYRSHLKKAFGALPLHQIGVSEISRFRAGLVEKELTEKRINNILTVLSKTLRYAAEIELIDRMPRIGLFRVERPEIEPWTFEEYARLLRAAEYEGTRWYAAVCLAGEAGLRVGEVKALRWREDVDLVARTLTVNRQMRRGMVTTPKGRTRRVIPMTDRLVAALKAIPIVREGLVFCRVSGDPLSDGQGQRGLDRVCRLAGLPQRQWHVLRHTFATHAAMFGVNPWSLQSWMGHKRIEETMIYVSYANAHRSPIPSEVLAAGHGEIDPDRRVVRMLSAREKVPAATSRGTVVAQNDNAEEKQEGYKLVN